MSVLCGCLVTNPVEFQDENFPPELVDHPSATPIGRIVTIPLDDVERTETTFRAMVRDRNLGQGLVSRYRISTRVDGNLSQDVRPAPDLRIPESSIETEIELRIPHSELLGGAGQCARLDLFVSSGFVPRLDPDRLLEPEQEGDLAKATWWIWQVSDEISSIDPATCPLEDEPNDPPTAARIQQP